ncbi:MAG TPA: phosphatidate cytidylyltransferase [Micromonosporaceae bacterium]
MSYDPAGWSHPSERDIRHGRHRARHADAAPEPYADGIDDGTPGEPYGYDDGTPGYDRSTSAPYEHRGAPPDDPYRQGRRAADEAYRYGDGLSAQPLYAPDPAQRRDPAPRREGRPGRQEPPTDPGWRRPEDRGWREPPTGPGWSEPDRDPRWSAPDPHPRYTRDPDPGFAPDRDSRWSDPDRDPRWSVRNPEPGWSAADRRPPAPPRPPEGYRSPPDDRADWYDEGTAPLDQVPPAEPSTRADAQPSPATGSTEPAGTGKPTRRRSRAERRSRGDGEPKKSRAGRDLPAAIGVGVGLGAVVLVALFVWRPAFLGVVVLAAGVATWELVRAIAGQGRGRAPLVPLLAGCVAMTALAWFAGLEAMLPGLVFTVLAALLWRIPDGPERYHRDAVAATLVTVYIPFLAGFAVLLLRPDDGSLRILVMLAAVVLSDTGGYAAGVFFGKHPMAPRVSPKKSWEGLAGSLVATAVGGALLLYYLFDVAWWHGVIFGLAVSAAAVLGDLAESLLKRDLGIKDMSSLLPGHGGLMDRLDSILFAAPVAYLLLIVLAPVAG